HRPHAVRGRAHGLLPGGRGPRLAGGAAMTATTREAAPAATSAVGRRRRLGSNPWGNPRFLWVMVILYIAWSILPVLIAIQFSFNAGRSRSVWQGFSLRWYIEDSASVLKDPSLRLALIQSVRL